MPISPVMPGIHPIGLRCKNFDVTKKFYRDIPGFALIVDSPGLIVFAAGPVFIAFKIAVPKDTDHPVFTPFEIGLDHIALTCETEEELHRVTRGLVDAGVENTGVKRDEGLQKLYVAFKDPDRIQWEFYMR